MAAANSHTIASIPNVPQHHQHSHVRSELVNEENAPQALEANLPSESSDPPTVYPPVSSPPWRKEEAQRLIQERTETPPEKPVTWLSLPHKPQLLILAMCRLSEPLSNTCLLPYIYYLMRSVESPDDSSAETSRQSGLVVALFALAQFATSMPWARFADRYGRKTSIVVGLTVSILANIGFGFARSIPALMFWRVLSGVANGNIGVMRTMTAEIVKERKYQSRAFLLLPLVFNMGTVIGLALGGALADPVVSIPSLFGPQGAMNFARDPEGVAWMRAYPFALPTMVNAVALAFSLSLAFIGLKETLPEELKVRERGSLFLTILQKMRKIVSRGSKHEYVQLEAYNDRNGESVEKGLLANDDGEVKLKSTQTTPLKTPFFSRSTWTREVLYMLLSFALLPLHNAAFMQVFPVFLSTPHSENIGASAIFFNGGLGLSSSIIGLWLSAFGILGILVQLMIYPRLQAYRGTLWAYRLALIMFPLAYIAAPYLSLCPTQGALRWVGIFFILFVQVTARTFAIPSSVILLTNVAPSKKVLGTIHGAGNMVSSLSRAVGPAVAGWVLGWGMDMGSVGAVWWLYLTIVAGFGYLWSWKLREGERP
jgi:Na+/melibiose symporter-like transporter